MIEEEIKTLTNIYTDSRDETCVDTHRGAGVTYVVWTSDVICAYRLGEYAEVSNGKAVLTKTGGHGTVFAEQGDHTICATYFDVNGDEGEHTTFKLTLTSSNSLSTGGGVLSSPTPLTPPVGGVTQ